MKILSGIRGQLGERARRKVFANQALRELVTLNTPSTGASYFDYWLLYSHIRKTRPREVLELGPGITTLVIAQALSENGSGRVTAMEDLKKYHDALDEIVPDRLRPYIDLRLSPAREVHWGPFRGKAYGEIPDRAYEFAWVDGPNYDREREFDADILEIIAKSDKPITAFVDSRLSSGFFYRMIFGRNFKYDHIRRIGFLTASKHDMKSFDDIVRATKTRGVIYGLFRV